MLFAPILPEIASTTRRVTSLHRESMKRGIISFDVSMPLANPNFQLPRNLGHLNAAGNGVLAWEIPRFLTQSFGFDLGGDHERTLWRCRVCGWRLGYSKYDSASQRHIEGYRYRGTCDDFTVPPPPATQGLGGGPKAGSRAPTVQ
jgi:hypothetical protein